MTDYLALLGGWDGDAMEGILARLPACTKCGVLRGVDRAYRARWPSPYRLIATILHRGSELSYDKRLSLLAQAEARIAHLPALVGKLAVMHQRSPRALSWLLDPGNVERLGPCGEVVRLRFPRCYAGLARLCIACKRDTGYADEDGLNRSEYALVVRVATIGATGQAKASALRGELQLWNNDSWQAVWRGETLRGHGEQHEGAMLCPSFFERLTALLKREAQRHGHANASDATAHNLLSMLSMRLLSDGQDSGEYGYGPWRDIEHAQNPLYRDDFVVQHFSGSSEWFQREYGEEGEEEREEERESEEEEDGKEGLDAQIRQKPWPTNLHTNLMSIERDVDPYLESQLRDLIELAKILGVEDDAATELFLDGRSPYHMPYGEYQERQGAAVRQLSRHVVTQTQLTRRVVVQHPLMRYLVSSLVAADHSIPTTDATGCIESLWQRLQLSTRQDAISHDLPYLDDVSVHTLIRSTDDPTYDLCMYITFAIEICRDEDSHHMTSIFYVDLSGSGKDLKEMSRQRLEQHGHGSPLPTPSYGNRGASDAVLREARGVLGFPDRLTTFTIHEICQAMFLSYVARKAPVVSRFANDAPDLSWAFGDKLVMLHDEE